MLNSQAGGWGGNHRSDPVILKELFGDAHRRKHLHLNQRKSSHNAFSRKSSHCHVNTEEQFILWVTKILQKWYQWVYCVWKHSVCTSSASHVTSVHVLVTAMCSKPSTGCKRVQENPVAVGWFLNRKLRKYLELKMRHMRPNTSTR